METEKKENLMNKRINPRAEEIADLPATDEQARQVKGGLNYEKIVFEYKPHRPEGTLE